MSERIGLLPAKAPPAGEFGAYDTEESYQATVMRLRLDESQCRQRLAVAVTKADRLALMPEDRRPGGSSARIAAWLKRHGLDNVVLAAGRDFKMVRYFHVSSVPGHPLGAAAPSRWLLERDRVDLGGRRAS